MRKKYDKKVMSLKISLNMLSRQEVKSIIFCAFYNLILWLHMILPFDLNSISPVLSDTILSLWNTHQQIMGLNQKTPLCSWEVYFYSEMVLFCPEELS